MTPDMTPDTDYEPELLEEARVMFARPWTFTRGVPSMSFLPDADGVEVAFAGRSNVGKSSLINALTSQHGLARTSNTPGRTQELNFFVSEAGITIVDMPGYGFAKAPKAKVDAWNRLIRSYLRGRPNLRRVYVLIDSRHGIKANDREVMTMLDQAAVSYQVVLTKADKISPPALETLTGASLEILRKHPASHPALLATSSEKRLGLDGLRAEIALLREG